MASTAHPANTAPQGVSERRRHGRAAVRLPISATLDGDEIRILCSDVSVGGACCHSESSVPVMTRLDVALRLPPDGAPAGAPITAEELHLHAVVVRCEPDPASPDLWKLAIFFLEPEPTALSRLSRYVHEHQEVRTA